MKILQSKSNSWYLNRRRIVSRSTDLKDITYCEEKLEYATMSRSHLVPDSYSEAADTLYNCYAALLRFSETYFYPSRYVFINKDTESPLFERLYGKGKYFIGEVPFHQYKIVKKEIKELNGRSVVVETDWYIQFRDSLVLDRF
jgi:hypothetical protein